jgi:hypothetical protein
VYRGTSSRGEGSTPVATGITSTTITSTTYTDTGLTNGTAYYYKVAAVNATGSSGYSNEASATPAVVNIVLTPSDFGYAGSGSPQGAYFEFWGNSYAEFPVVFPQSGGYSFTIPAYVARASGTGTPNQGLTEIRIDQHPIPSGTMYSQYVPQTTASNIVYYSYVTSGTHNIALTFMNSSNQDLFLGTLTIENNATGYQIPPVEPTPHDRNPLIQPFSSYSYWNTSIGSGAVWSASSDADATTLHNATAGGINSGQWSMPIYTPATTDPLAVFACGDNTYPLEPSPVTLNLTAGATPAPPVGGGDHHIIIYSPDGNTIYHLFGATNDGNGTWTCMQSMEESVYGMAWHGYLWAAGVIRAAELTNRLIPHTLRYALPTTMYSHGDTWISGLQWPATNADFSSVSSYIGTIKYGSLIGIPASVNINTLGLSADGLVLARCLQDYGATSRDSGGSGLLLYAEEAAEGMSQLNNMRNDLNKIIPHLQIIRNDSPTAWKGGGTLRQPLADGIRDP